MFLVCIVDCPCRSPWTEICAIFRPSSIRSYRVWKLLNVGNHNSPSRPSVEAFAPPSISWNVRRRDEEAFRNIIRLDENVPSWPSIHASRDWIDMVRQRVPISSDFSFYNDMVSKDYYPSASICPFVIPNSWAANAELYVMSIRVVWRELILVVSVCRVNVLDSWFAACSLSGVACTESINFGAVIWLPWGVKLRPYVHIDFREGLDEDLERRDCWIEDLNLRTWVQEKATGGGQAFGTTDCRVLNQDFPNVFDD